MPTRKITERERLTIYARTATDEQLAEAAEILAIERRVRAASKPKPAPAKKAASKSPAKKPAAPAKRESEAPPADTPAEPQE